METIFIMISVYVASVFLARWFDKILFKLDQFHDPSVVLWFVPFIGFLTIFVMLLIELNGRSRTNWFTGKYWK